MINTLLGMVIDTDRMQPVLAGVTGGLSGPAIRPVAVRCVWQVHQALPTVPIIGMGGIRSGSTHCSSCSPARPPCRSARLSSVTRARRRGWPASSPARSPTAGSSGSSTP
jgi:hypothetical protein